MKAELIFRAAVAGLASAFIWWALPILFSAAFGVEPRFPVYWEAAGLAVFLNKPWFEDEEP